MRILFPALALFVASPVLADDFTTPLTATAATVYSAGASVTYRAALDLPAGQHRVLLPYDLNGYGFTPPQLKTSDGVSIGAINYLDNVAYDQDALLSSDQASAKAAVEAARDAITEKQVQIRTVSLQLEALDTQMGFVKSISGGELTDADPAQVRALAQMVRDEAEAAIARRLDLEKQTRDLSDELDDLTDNLTEAERLFARLSPPAGQGGMMVVSVEVAAEGTARFDVVRIIHDARWSVDYDFRLAYGDDPSLMVERNVVVEQRTGQAWSNVDLVLSTANPFSQSAPSDAGRNLAQIYETKPTAKFSSNARMAGASEMMMIDAVMVEAPSVVATAMFDGLSLNYVYPRKVTLGDNEAVQLVLDSFSLPVETSLLAIPRRDETAFVMAAVTNDTDEPLLPGTASYYRDGSFIGRGGFELIPAGGKADLPFGGMEGVRLTYTALRQETGDSGLITTSNTREDQVEFSIENLTSKPQRVRVLYALPYSQQENLEISTRIHPNPTEADVDNVRGVAAWDMKLAPNDSQKVQLTTTLSWPKGLELSWAQ